MFVLLFPCLIATISASCNVNIRLGAGPTVITSLGYPSDYDKSQSCWWKVIPMYQDSTIRVVLEDISMESSPACQYDYLVIYNGPDATSPSLGKYCLKNQTKTIHSTTPSMYLGFTSDGSNQFRGFSLKAYETYSIDRSKILLHNSVKLDCTSTGWLAEVDMAKLAILFPNTDTHNIFMSNQFCRGTVHTNTIIFNSSFADCNTEVKESNDSVIMSNYLIEYIHDSQTQLVTGSLWRYDLSCYLHKNETDHISFVPIDNNTLSAQTTDVVATSQAVIKFYSDQGFTHPMTGNPLKVSLGTRVYVQVEAHLPDNIKLILNSCDVTGDLNDANSTTVALIHNRCAANHFTHILGSIPRLARFYFDVFEIHHPRANLYVNCDITFCPMMDFSPQCQNTCQQANP